MKKKFLLLIMILLSSCNEYAPSTALDNTLFLESIQGVYEITPLAVSAFNGYFKVSPVPLFTKYNLMDINNYGLLCIVNNDNTARIVMTFECDLLDKENTAIFRLEIPYGADISPSIKSKPYLLIKISGTKLLFSDFSENKISVQQLIPSYYYADVF